MRRLTTHLRHTVLPGRIQSVLVCAACGWLLAASSCKTPAAAAAPVALPMPTAAEPLPPDSLLFFSFRLTHDSARSHSQLSPLRRQAVAGTAKALARPAAGGQPRLVWAVLRAAGDTAEAGSAPHPLHYTAEGADEAGSLRAQAVHLPQAETFIRVAIPAGGRSLAVWEEVLPGVRASLGLFKL